MDVNAGFVYADSVTEQTMRHCYRANNAAVSFVNADLVDVRFVNAPC